MVWVAYRAACESCGCGLSRARVRPLAGLRALSDGHERRGAVEVQQGVHRREGVSRLQGLAQALGLDRVETEASHVPRVELAQVPRSAGLAEVLHGAVDRPVQLVQ